MFHYVFFVLLKTFVKAFKTFCTLQLRLTNCLWFISISIVILVFSLPLHPWSLYLCTVDGVFLLVAFFSAFLTSTLRIRLPLAPDRDTWPARFRSFRIYVLFDIRFFDFLSPHFSFFHTLHFGFFRVHVFSPTFSFQMLIAVFRLLTF